VKIYKKRAKERMFLSDIVQIHNYHKYRTFRRFEKEKSAIFDNLEWNSG